MVTCTPQKWYIGGCKYVYLDDAAHLVMYTDDFAVPAAGYLDSGLVRLHFTYGIEGLRMNSRYLRASS